MKQEMQSYIRANLAEKESFTAEFCFPASFSGFKGHFPGQPILPSVCLIQAVLVATQQATGRNLELSEIVLSKFFAVTRPDQKLSAAIKMDEDMVRAKISRGEDRVAEIRLRVRDA